jgi:hypothetical protein
VRVAKAMCMVANRVESRMAFKRWLGFSAKVQRLDQRANDAYAKKALKQKREAIRKLRRFKNDEIRSRNRNYQVLTYFAKKTLLSYFSTLKQNAHVVKRRRENRRSALKFRKWCLLKKSVFGFASSTL